VATALFIVAYGSRAISGSSGHDRATALDEMRQCCFHDTGRTEHHVAKHLGPSLVGNGDRLVADEAGGDRNAVETAQCLNCSHDSSRCTARGVDIVNQRKRPRCACRSAGCGSCCSTTGISPDDSN
jgi:hypothetical protein